jgi:hypothetical protein
MRNPTPSPCDPKPVKQGVLSRYQLTRAGGGPQSGQRKSMPSQSIAGCAEVSRTAPSPSAGQGKRPRSKTF